MNNAEYVKSLGLEFKDLTAKIEDYSEADKLYTWGILNKKTNKRIGLYRSFDKKDFPVVPVIIGEWLLQEDAYAKDYFNINSKALLRYKLNKIAREFVNDTSISGKFLCKNQYAYFNNLQSYADRVNKLLGKKDLCDTFHAPFLNEERKEIYIVYDSKHYTLGSVCGEAREVCYDKIYEFVDKYIDSTCNKDPKESLGDDLNKIAMEFVDDVMNDDAKALSKALKTALNSAYGLTSASFSNAMKNQRNINNIVALRGALVMKTLQDDVQQKGFTIIHIKTDSNIEEFVYDFLEDTTND